MKNIFALLILLFINLSLYATDKQTIRGDLTIKGSTTITSDILLTKFDTDDADTVTLLLYKLTGGIDTASIVDAADGWTTNLLSYPEFYNKAELLMSLPLPYPDFGTEEAHGQDREQINAKYAYYQIEFELERLHRYLKQEWDRTDRLNKEFKWLKRFISILIVIIGLQQYQIYKNKLS